MRCDSLKQEERIAFAIRHHRVTLCVPPLLNLLIYLRIFYFLSEIISKRGKILNWLLICLHGNVGIFKISKKQAQ